MNFADWLVVSVMAHYLAAGLYYWISKGQPLLFGLYFCYASANVFLILMAMKMSREAI